LVYLYWISKGRNGALEMSICMNRVYCGRKVGRWAKAPLLVEAEMKFKIKNQPHNEFQYYYPRLSYKFYYNLFPSHNRRLEHLIGRPMQYTQGWFLPTNLFSFE